MTKVVEVWADTGEIVERDFTAEEKAQRAEDAKAEELHQKNRDAEAKVCADAIAHAKTLGFTNEMIAVMYPNLTLPNP
jgi:hypothetical protein